MKLQVDNLGKVAITVEQGYWNFNKDYDKLTIVEQKNQFATFISRKPVPAGKLLTNREYWIPFSSLKESIVLDYNSFISKYGETLKLIQEDVNTLISDVDKLKELKTDIVTAIAEAKLAVDSANESLNIVKDYIDALGFNGVGDGLQIVNNILKVKSITVDELDKILI